MAKELMHEVAPDKERLAALRKSLRDPNYELWLQRVDGEIAAS